MNIDNMVVLYVSTLMLCIETRQMGYNPMKEHYSRRIEYGYAYGPNLSDLVSMATGGERLQTAEILFVV